MTSRGDDPASVPGPGAILASLDPVVAGILELEAACAADLSAAAPEHHASLRNLAHYLALRRHDLRGMQGALAALGLSSLGRSESHVLDNLDAVRRALAALAGVPPRPRPPGAVALREGAELLRRNTARLLGPPRPGRDVRIMVTMPTEAATDPALVRELVAEGMDIMRINCAHDGPDAWGAMVENLRAATPGGARRVLMDVEGPKLRTGPVEPGPQVVSWNPPRSEVGDLLRPAAVWITRAEAPAAPAGLAPDAVLPMPAVFVGGLRAGDEVVLRDHPGRTRRLAVIAAEPGGVLAHSTHSAYVTPGVEVQGPRGARAVVPPLPAAPGLVELRTGETLVVTAGEGPGRGAVRDASGKVVSPARVTLTPERIFRDIRAGHRVMLDDGKATCVVEKVEQSGAVLRVTRCRGGRLRLGAEKGINLPDTVLDLPALSPEDAGHLPFIARHADMIGFSFVQRRSDIDLLREGVAAAGRPDLGLVLKIETAAAFAALPDLLMTAMRSPSVGVMIARGDLATQVGWERLAEVQEEILWICEAAHVPVVWATQVLETLAKKGLPSRSEITDAAMGERAECVMLNKGPFVVDALRMLDAILHRMGDHQSKKRSMLRPLSVARRFGEPRGGAR